MSFGRPPGFPKQSAAEPVLAQPEETLIVAGDGSHQNRPYRAGL